MQKIVDFKNVSFSYGTKPIISSLNIEIYKGDFIGIFGENGSGKTTLVKLLLGILNLDQGDIFWYDKNGKKTSKSKFSIEYISQKAQTIDSLIPITVKELLSIGSKSKGSLFDHFNHTCSYQTIEASLNHVDMLEYIHCPFNNLSGGQKQRVLIAKALISNPDIIIMDEPTAGVDFVAQKHFYDLLSHLNTDHAITIIVVSHDTRFIQDKIKRVWYMSKLDCEECGNESIHFMNIRSMFNNQNPEFISLIQ